MATDSSTRLILSTCGVTKTRGSTYSTVSWLYNSYAQKICGWNLVTPFRGRYADDGEPDYFSWVPLSLRAHVASRIPEKAVRWLRTHALANIHVRAHFFSASFMGTHMLSLSVGGHPLPNSGYPPKCILIVTVTAN